MRRQHGNARYQVDVTSITVEVTELNEHVKPLTQPMTAPRELAVGFTRKPLLRHPDVLIESVCDYCGFSIIASAPESLDRDELEHREECGDRDKASH